MDKKIEIILDSPINSSVYVDIGFRKTSEGTYAIMLDNNSNTFVSFIENFQEAITEEVGQEDLMTLLDLEIDFEEIRDGIDVDEYFEDVSGVVGSYEVSISLIDKDDFPIIHSKQRSKVKDGVNKTNQDYTSEEELKAILAKHKYLKTAAGIIGVSSTTLRTKCKKHGFNAVDYLNKI